MPETREKDWLREFRADEISTKFQTWLFQADQADRLMENKFTLSDLGLREDAKGYVNWNNIPHTVNKLVGRLMNNAIQPRISPHENDYAEEDVCQLALAFLVYEARQYRGPYDLNLAVQTKKSGTKGLRSGQGYLDMRIDTSLRDSEHPRGLGLYRALNPQDVILDRRAASFNEIQHLHIIHSSWPEEVEQAFKGRHPIFKQARSDAADSERTQGKVDVVETQYLKMELTRFYQLTDEQRREILFEGEGINRPDFDNHLNDLMQRDPAWAFFDREAFLQYTPYTENFAWGWWSCYGTNFRDEKAGQKLNQDAIYLGKHHTLLCFQVFTIANSPYAYGIPYFQKDQAAMIMQAKTMLSRLVETLDRKRTTMLGEPSDRYKEQYKKNEMGGLLWFDKADLPEGITDIRQAMFQENPHADMQNLMAYTNALEMEMDNTFSTPPLEGQAPYAGASGRAIEALQSVGDATIFSMFQGQLNDFLSRVYERALQISLVTLTSQAMMTIGGENDEDRAKLIAEGTIFKRLSALNISVELDLSGPGDKAREMEVAGMLLKAGFKEPEILGRLGFRQPVKMSQLLKQAEMEQNADLAMGKKVNSDPIATALVQRYWELQQQRQQKQLTA